MAKISNTESYPFQSPIEGADYLIGTAANSTTIPKQTKTFTISGISNFIIDTIGSIGTVTSVSATAAGSALNVTGSPITTEGTLAFTWDGLVSQYVNGEGGLTTFPIIPQGTVTSVGLSSDVTAFAVGSSPITSSGTISLNLNGGYAGQFLRQDGNWATVPATDLTGYQITSEKGNADGYAPLDTNNKVPTIHLPAAIVGAVIYKGTFDAAPPSTLPDPTTVKGDYYVVSNPGTYLGIAYALGDWIISNGANWQKVDNSAGVNSVNGATGTVLLNLANLGDVTGGTTAGQVLTRNANNTYDFQTPDPGVGTTDLTNTASETEVTVNSSTGNNTSIASASATIAGVMTSADKTKLDKAIIGTTVDQTAIAEINTLTQASYDALVSAGTTLSNVMYVISSGNTPEPPGPDPGPEIEICSLIWTNANSTETELIAGGNIPIVTTSAELYGKFLQGQPAACYWQFDESKSDRGLYYNLYARNVVKPPSGFRLPTNSDYDTLTSAPCNPNGLNQNRHAAELPNNYREDWLTNTDFIGDSKFNAYGYGGVAAHTSELTLWQRDATSATFWSSSNQNQAGSRIEIRVSARSSFLEYTEWQNSSNELASIRFVKDA